MTTEVAADATSRAWRTLLQGLTFDVLAAVALVIFTAVSKANAWGDLEWSLVTFTLVKSATVAGLSYLMRTVFASQFPVES